MIRGVTTSKKLKYTPSEMREEWPPYLLSGVLFVRVIRVRKQVCKGWKIQSPVYNINMTPNVHITSLSSLIGLFSLLLSRTVTLYEHVASSVVISF